MAGHSWLSERERQVVLAKLRTGASWATSAALVTGTADDKVDATFCDTMQTILEAQVAKELRAVQPDEHSILLALVEMVTPTFISITPATGDAGGGETVVILGTGFYKPTVTIGGHAQTVVHWTPTSIEIKTVAHAAEAAQHVVITNGTTAALSVDSGAAYATIASATPTFTSIAPVTGSTLGGAACCIVGTNFKEGVAVKFGTTPALVTGWDATHIWCVAPKHAAGAVALVITNPNTLHADPAAAFTYVHNATP